VFKDGEDDYVMHNSSNYDSSRSVSGEQNLKPGNYTVRLRISASRYPSLPTLAEVIKQNSKEKRSKLMQLGSKYDIAHAKGLGFAALRAKHAQREREAAEAKRKAKERKAREKGEKVEAGVEDDDDDEPEQWNALCVVGLKVYTQEPELELEVRQHPVIERFSILFQRTFTTRIG